MRTCLAITGQILLAFRIFYSGQENTADPIHGMDFDAFFSKNSNGSADLHLFVELDDVFVEHANTA